MVIDGRDPFGRKLLEEAGFSVVAIDQDDSQKGFVIGQTLGFDLTMDLKKDFRAMYTLLRSRSWRSERWQLITCFNSRGSFKPTRSVHA